MPRKGNALPRAFCIMTPGVAVCSEVKGLWPGAEAKASAKCAASVACSRPETRRSMHGQAEGDVKVPGGPNSFGLKTDGMTCGSGAKN